METTNLSIQEYSDILKQLASAPQRLLLSPTDQAQLKAISDRLARRVELNNKVQLLQKN